MRLQPLTPEPSEAEIQHDAYLLWEQEGRPPGRDLEFWLSAQERLRHTVHPPGGKRQLAIRATVAARNAQSADRKYR